MQVKVCGITDIGQAKALDALGVHFIGFIFYPSSKRYVLNNLSERTVGIFVEYSESSGFGYGTITWR
jgi:phosphoribosylanthranilate isomerase